MFHNNRTLHIASLTGLLIITLIGCQMFERHAQSPTTPATGDSSALTNYAQMEGGSTVVDGQQINWVVSEWGSFPYRNWVYVEVN